MQLPANSIHLLHKTIKPRKYLTWHMVQRSTAYDLKSLERSQTIKKTYRLQTIPSEHPSTSESEMHFSSAVIKPIARQSVLPAPHSRYKSSLMYRPVLEKPLLVCWWCSIELGDYMLNWFAADWAGWVTAAFVILHNQTKSLWISHCSCYDCMAELSSSNHM